MTENNETPATNEVKPFRRYKKTELLEVAEAFGVDLNPDSDRNLEIIKQLKDDGVTEQAWEDLKARNAEEDIPVVPEPPADEDTSNVSVEDINEVVDEEEPSDVVSEPTADEPVVEEPVDDDYVAEEAKVEPVVEETTPVENEVITEEAGASDDVITEPTVSEPRVDPVADEIDDDDEDYFPKTPAVEPEINEEKEDEVTEEVEEEDLVLIKMTRLNYTYEARGYQFSRSHPYSLVKESDADYLVDEEGGFQIASPQEVRSFYS